MHKSRMTILLRFLAVIAFVSVILTLWLIAILGSAGGLRQLPGAGAIGWTTMIGWAIALTAGRGGRPVVAAARVVAPRGNPVVWFWFRVLRSSV
jgi:hypothetical protein